MPNGVFNKYVGTVDGQGRVTTKVITQAACDGPELAQHEQRGLPFALTSLVLANGVAYTCVTTRAYSFILVFNLAFNFNYYFNFTFNLVSGVIHAANAPRNTLQVTWQKS